MKRPCVRPSVRPSVCFVDRAQQRRAAGLLLSARRTGDIDRLLHLHGAHAGGGTRFSYLGGLQS